MVATPTQVVDGGVVTQVGGDHTTGTGDAFFSAVNTAAGTNDVDGGACIVESPVYPVAAPSSVSIWYFHGQRDGGGDPGDRFLLELSTNGGTSWAPLAAFGDQTVSAAWTEATAAVPAGSNVKLRLEVADGTATGDLIEAGVDDLRICPTAPECTRLRRMRRRPVLQRRRDLRRRLLPGGDATRARRSLATRRTTPASRRPPR